MRSNVSKIGDPVLHKVDLATVKKRARMGGLFKRVNLSHSHFGKFIHFAFECSAGNEEN